MVPVQVGHVTCDNASNNGTMLEEFARLIEHETGKPFDPINRRIKCVLCFAILLTDLISLRSCMAHVINLATQAVIATYSKAPHFNPHDPDSVEVGVAASRDEVGLIRAISVKVCPNRTCDYS